MRAGRDRALLPSALRAYTLRARRYGCRSLATRDAPPPGAPDPLASFQNDRAGRRVGIPCRRGALLCDGSVASWIALAFRSVAADRARPRVGAVRVARSH